ncbi:MAG: thrombospondin type 3 repeat-containing protein [Dehalococcoidia bacterium]
MILAIAVAAGMLAAARAPGNTEATFPGGNGKIAFSRATGTGINTDVDIYLANANGSSAEQLTSGPTLDYSPNWSPDGRQIAFRRVTGFGGPNIDAQIYVMNADGSNQVKITEGAGQPQNPKWSPDGTRIAFMSDQGLGIMDSDGSNRALLAAGAISGTASWPAWSPDGTRIAVYENHPTVGGGVFAVNVDGSGEQFLFSVGVPGSLDWSPDGEKLTFTANGGSALHVFVANADGSGGITDLGLVAAQSSWSPDGEKIVFAQYIHQPTGSVFAGITVASASGGGQMNLSSGDDQMPDWQPVPGECKGAPAAPAAMPTAAPTPTPVDDDRDGDNLPNDIEADIGTNPDCQDTDGDGLLDPWEVDPATEGAGFDLDEDGTPDVDRDEVFGPYAGECGAETTGFRREPNGQFCALNHEPDPLHKDTYLEIDWQDCWLGDCPELLGFKYLDPSHHAPDRLGMVDAINVFNSAPVENPDENDGVNLNFLVDESLLHTVNCDQHDAAQRAAHFGTVEQRGDADVIQAKALAVRYGWSGHSSVKDDGPNACPLPAFWELITSGLGACCLPEYDISPAGWADPRGRDVIISLAVTWVCQLFSLDGGGTLPPCFREEPPAPAPGSSTGIALPIPGLFPALVENPGGAPRPVPLPMHMMLGVPQSQGVRVLWGKTLMNLLGWSLGVPQASILDDPSAPNPLDLVGYSDWSGLQYAPPNPETEALAQPSGAAEFEPTFPDLSLAEQDMDGDGIPEGVDNCPGLSNDQADFDQDGAGDPCDNDDDGDGLEDTGEGNPLDTDNDGAPNGSDSDDDGDGVDDDSDTCVLAPNADQLNSDSDAPGDACDLDDDADGLPDILETEVGSDPAVAGSLPEFLGNEDSCSDGEDNDGDGHADGADSGCVDPDGDTVPNLLDNCPGVASVNVFDSDDDGVGNPCEPAGTERTWGDNNCSGEADPVDALLALRFDAGLPTNTGACPAMGVVVEVQGASPHPWGDIDCTGDVGPIDGLKLLRFDSGLSVSQEPDCPLVGGGVVVAAGGAAVPQGAQRWRHPWVKAQP